MNTPKFIKRGAQFGGIVAPVVGFAVCICMLRTRDRYTREFGEHLHLVTVKTYPLSTTQNAVLSAVISLLVLPLIGAGAGAVTGRILASILNFGAASIEMAENAVNAACDSASHGITNLCLFAQHAVHGPTTASAETQTIGTRVT